MFEGLCFWGPGHCVWTRAVFKHQLKGFQKGWIILNFFISDTLCSFKNQSLINYKVQKMDPKTRSYLVGS